MKSIDPKLDLELSAFICGWDVLEKRIGGDDIIDMNLSDLVAPKEYQYRYDVLQDVEEFLKIDEIRNHDIIRRKLTSHRYLLLKMLGEVIPFDEYFENTMGLKPTIYPDKKIETVKEITNGLLDLVGLKMQENVRADLMKLDEQLAYKEFPKLFDDHHKFLYKKIHETTSVTVDFETRYKQIDQDISKIAEIRGDGKAFDITFNMFHMKNDSVAILKHLSAHELSGHGVQFAALRQKADKGELPRYVTYLTLAEPIQFSAEGIAETVQYFYPEMFDQLPLTQAVFAMDRQRRVVTNNAAVWANRGENFQDCVEYMYKHFPNWPKNYIAHQLSSRTNKPIGSSSAMIYSPALESFMEISRNHKDKYGFLASAYQDFLMPEQIQSQLTVPITDFI